jgi:superfamily I DNA and/or RNA helicase
MSKKGVNAQVVLAGDHKQLRPVVTNTFAKDMGLEVSDILINLLRIVLNF